MNNRPDPVSYLLARFFISGTALVFAGAGILVLVLNNMFAGTQYYDPDITILWVLLRPELWFGSAIVGGIPGLILAFLQGNVVKFSLKRIVPMNRSATYRNLLIVPGILFAGFTLLFIAMAMTDAAIWFVTLLWSFLVLIPTIVTIAVSLISCHFYLKALQNWSEIYDPRKSKMKNEDYARLEDGDPAGEAIYDEDFALDYDHDIQQDRMKS